MPRLTETHGIDLGTVRDGDKDPNFKVGVELVCRESLRLARAGDVNGL